MMFMNSTTKASIEKTNCSKFVMKEWSTKVYKPTGIVDKITIIARIIGFFRFSVPANFCTRCFSASSLFLGISFGHFQSIIKMLLSPLCKIKLDFRLHFKFNF